MKLAARIVGVSLLSVFLLALVAVFALVKTVELEFELDQRETAERVGKALSVLLIDEWRNFGEAGVTRLLRQGGPASTLGFDVRWVVFEETASKDFQPILPRELWPSRNSPKTVSFVHVAPNGERFLRTYVPFVVEGRPVGGLEFAGSLSPLQRHTRTVIQIWLATIGMLSLMFIALAYFAGIRWIGRPLQALISKANRVGRGDFTEPLKVSSRDEFGSLAESFNYMCEHLREQREAVEHETAQRIEALEQLRHADRLKTIGHLAAGVAHELGTPLNVISGRAGLIVSGKLAGHELQASAQAIKAEADHITDIVRQLLAFARLRKPQLKSVDLVGVIRTAAELLGPLADRQNVRIQIASPQQSVVAVVDAVQIQQVFTNIVVNAIQAMPEGGCVYITSEIVPSTLENSSAEKMACVSVSDTGQGMSAETLKQAFAPFFTTKGPGEGTGLGLSIALGIVQEHGGRIDVDSQPGKGTLFRIMLPTEKVG